MATLPCGIDQRIARTMRNTRREINKATKREAREVRAKADQRAAIARAIAVDKRLAEANERRRLPLAVEGASALLVLSRHLEIRKLCKLRGKAFVFYAAARPSGEAWENPGGLGTGTRDVKISVDVEGIHILCGSYGVEMEEVFIPADITPEKVSEILLSSELPFCHDDARANTKLALNRNQRKDEWTPRDVAAQVLVECANTKQFTYFLRKALED